MMICTTQELADMIGATRQWVHYKIREAKKKKEDTIIFYIDKDKKSPIEMKVISKPRQQILLGEVKG